MASSWPPIRPVCSAKPTALRAVDLAGDPHVVTLVGGRPVRRGAVGQRAVQVLLLQHLAELLRPPVGDQELDPGVRAGAAVAVVPEHRADPGPHVGDLLGPDEDPQPLGEHRVGGQPAPDPQVVPDLAPGVAHADERDVVDLVVGAVVRATGDRGLELARQVGERRVTHVLVDGLGDRRRSRPAPRRPAPRPAGSPGSPGGCHRRPRWWTGRRPPAAPRSPGRPRSGSSAAGRSAGR